MFTFLTLVLAQTIALAAPLPVVDCPSPAKWSVSTTNTLVCVTTTTTPPPECTTDCNPPPECTTDCPPPPGGDVCASNDTKTPNNWGNSTVETSEYGNFVHQTLAVRITVPLTASGGSIRTSSWVEYGTGKFQRDGAFSTVACSFDPKDALANGYGGKVTTKGNVAPSFLYRIGNAQGGAVGLTPGQTYWINLRNRDSDGAQNCTVPSCTMRGNIPN